MLQSQERYEKTAPNRLSKVLLKDFCDQRSEAIDVTSR
jgi:hypothetical protein